MRKNGIAAIALVVGTSIGSAMAGSSTTTSTTVPSSTTSTTLPPACDDAATFDSILCRLDELSAALAGASELGSLGPKLGHAVDKADNSTNIANDQCDAGDAKTAGKRLKKAIRRMIQYGHRLRSLKSRNTIPEEVRQPFIDDGKAIQDDMKALKSSLVCPPASPSGAFL